METVFDRLHQQVQQRDAAELVDRVVDEKKVKIEVTIEAIDGMIVALRRTTIPVEQVVDDLLDLRSLLTNGA